MAKGDLKEPLNLRLSPNLKRKVEDYAARTGISLNAAASILIDKGLTSEKINAQ